MANDLLRDYLKAKSQHDDRLREYLDVQWTASGEVSKEPKTLTEEAATELAKLGQEVEEKRLAWLKNAWPRQGD